MLGKIKMCRKSAIAVFVPFFVPIFLLMALSFFLGQGFFPTSLSAQETQVPTDSQYPILNESDFLLTLKVLDNIEAGPDNFIKETGISKEHLQAVLGKIFANYAIIVDGKSEEQVISHFGPSVIFNKEERELFAKFQDRIKKGAEGYIHYGE